MAGLIEKLHKIGDVLNTVARVALGVTSIALCIAVIGQFILRWFGATMPWQRSSPVISSFGPRCLAVP